jgi:hypothetical protein
MAEHYWGKDAIEVRFAECGHTRWIPLGHSAGHEHCFACNPELAQEPIPGKCPKCSAAQRRLTRPSQKSSANPKTNG